MQEFQDISSEQHCWRFSRVLFVCMFFMVMAILVARHIAIDHGDTPHEARQQETFRSFKASMRGVFGEEWVPVFYNETWAGKYTDPPRVPFCTRLKPCLRSSPWSNATSYLPYAKVMLAMGARVGHCAPEDAPEARSTPAAVEAPLVEPVCHPTYVPMCLPCNQTDAEVILFGIHDIATSAEQAQVNEWVRGIHKHVRQFATNSRCTRCVPDLTAAKWMAADPRGGTVAMGACPGMARTIEELVEYGDSPFAEDVHRIVCPPSTQNE